MKAAQKPLRVVVLNYNHADHTLRCVASILSQSYRPLELVVVDNDSRPMVVAELEEKLPSEAILIKNPKNNGYAAGNNAGASLDTGREPVYVMIVNPDVRLPDPLACAKLISAFDHEPVRAACSPLVSPLSKSDLAATAIQVRRLPNFWQMLVSHSWWLRRLPVLRRSWEWYTYADKRPFILESEIDCESINGACFIIRHEVLRELHYLDEATFLYSEELILGKQLQSLGLRSCLVTSTVAEHDQGHATGHGGGRRNYRMLKHMHHSERHYARNYLGTTETALRLLWLVRLCDISTQWIVDAARRPFSRRWGGSPLRFRERR